MATISSLFSGQSSTTYARAQVTYTYSITNNPDTVVLTATKKETGSVSITPPGNVGTTAEIMARSDLQSKRAILQFGGNVVADYAVGNTGSTTISKSVTINKTHSSQTKNITLNTAGTAYTVSAKTSYTVSYAANGGSSTPSAQTKWYGESLALRAAISRTGYAFSKWKASNGTLYNAGASYTANAGTTLTAQWTANTYYVKYNANGGSGSMSNSTHTYDTTKALTANAFTRDKYLFKGWATSASGSVVYSNGQSVKNLTSTAGGTVNLYAVWEYQYAKPSFSSLSAWRTSNTASGGTYPKQDDGTNADVSVRVNPGQKKTTAGGSFSNVSSTVKFFYKLHTDSSYTQFGSAQTISAATTLTAHISATLDITKQYDIKVEASVIESGTTKESASLTTFISTATFLVDMSENGIAFGKVSQKAAFECNMHMYLDGNNPESRIYSYNHRKKSDYSGGWAYHPLTCLDDAGTDYAHFGVYGSANTLNYLYIGANSYDGNNLRIFSNGHIWANTMEIQKVTVGSNTFADANPKLIFKNVDGSQSGSLTWTDYDSVQSPASLTLNGNQGGEYFIAPNIKATTRFYGPLTGNVTGNCSGSSGSCTGNAATATKATQDGNGANIASTYLKLSGGTMTGQLTITHGKYIVLSGGNTTGSCSIYGGSYNDTRNLYYAVSRSDSYHAFYAGGDGIAYIYSDQVTFKKKVNVTGVITGSSTVYSGGNTMCSSDNAQYCGNSSHRWKAVYATNSSIQTSDRKDKDILGNIDFAKDLIMSLEPIQYMWKAGDHRRKRMGFVAQDVAEICNTLGENLSLVTASFGDEGEEGERLYLGEKVDDALLKWGMSYEQLIAPLVSVVQEQQKEIDELKRRVS